ncbi:MAG: ArnT family glycosyltransferase [Steroidobacteraceae bacterium]
MFDRGHWTPDEPREADIAWRMSFQTDRTLPQLADASFLEKPPLTYWLSGAAMYVFGDSAAASRAPNLLYAALVTFSIGALVFSMAGASAAVIAAITAGSAFTAYQVAIWLTPDACLVAGCAVALLGLYRGYTTTSMRSKLLWYTVMHVGALIGFMAKSGPGWIFPGLVLLVMIVWERRWNELLRWQLWAGLAIQALIIGWWIGAVLNHPDGIAALRVLFWNNLAGRFVDVHASGALDYASGHQNWPGKYLVELPYHLFPWTLLVVAALYRAWSAVKIAGSGGTPWRFAIAACVPFIALLSVATTARGIYIAPALLGFAILVGLWSRDLAAGSLRCDAFAIRATRYAVGVLVVIMIGGLCVMAIAESNASSDVSMVIALSGAAFVIAIVSIFCFASSARSQRQQRPYWSLGWSYVAFLSSIVVGGCVLFPIVDQWNDRGSIACEIKTDSAGHSLALLQPDETTIAMMDYQLQTPFSIVDSSDADVAKLAAHWFAAHPADGLILIKLPAHAVGKLTRLLNRLSKQKSPSDGMLLTLQQANIARLVKRYELPEGRRYALIESFGGLSPAGI